MLSQILRTVSTYRGTGLDSTVLSRPSPSESRVLSALFAKKATTMQHCSHLGDASPEYSTHFDPNVPTAEPKPGTFATFRAKGVDSTALFAHLPQKTTD